MELSPADVGIGHRFYRTTDVSYSISVLSETLGTLPQLQILTYLSLGTEVGKIMLFFCLFYFACTVTLRRKVSDSVSLLVGNFCLIRLDFRRKAIQGSSFTLEFQ
jgi:hypothetical protein